MGFVAGPDTTCPSSPKREPWQGQSHVRLVGVEGERATEVRAAVGSTGTGTRRPSAIWQRG
jgi:hypothetical protein